MKTDDNQKSNEDELPAWRKKWDSMSQEHQQVAIDRLSVMPFFAWSPLWKRLAVLPIFLWEHYKFGRKHMRRTDSLMTAISWTKLLLFPKLWRD